ncbi:hypothetical protein M427DRAFT_66470 [Gonapodya prolifera JEL478]|uniref:Uncharacterized protein n=1 Tax=Gonapodya prolifera (strain JEL478) TaxID=1344416 RepID=A0A139AUQ7_GONPJ|nr:hypothetical protein M427DRAFT_66470 [Gonapodya prolifera JEL478]|eukprot:KXS20476.1 hypothetical protein M427DRAFT_66470 [Gonapodya prolifera JEL478]
MPHPPLARKRSPTSSPLGLLLTACIAALAAFAIPAASQVLVAPNAALACRWPPLSFNATPVVSLELVNGPRPQDCRNYAGRLISNTLVCNDGSFSLLVPDTETCTRETLFVKITNPWGGPEGFCTLAALDTTGNVMAALDTTGTCPFPSPTAPAATRATESAAALPNPSCSLPMGVTPELPPEARPTSTTGGVASTSSASAAGTAGATPTGVDGGGGVTPSPTQTPAAPALPAPAPAPPPFSTPPAAAPPSTSPAPNAVLDTPPPPFSPPARVAVAASAAAAALVLGAAAVTLFWKSGRRNKHDAWAYLQ